MASEKFHKTQRFLKSSVVSSRSGAQAKLSSKSPKLSLDYSITSSYRQRSFLYRCFYHFPGFYYIRRLLLLDVEVIESEYLDESQELSLIRKKSAEDLFYPIHMARMPTVKTSRSTYFHDGKKKIDFVLLYERDDGEDEGPIMGVVPESDDTLPKDEVKPQERRRSSIHFKRESYLSYLQNAGISMEEDIVKSPVGMLHYVKLSVSWNLLIRFAEVLQLRVPLEIQPEITQNWSAVIFQRLGIQNIFMQYVPEEPLNFYTTTFKKTKLKNYLWSDQKDAFFSNTQRIHIINEILQVSQYGRMGKTEVGIDRLLKHKAFKAAYPVHDGNWKKSNREGNNMRYILYHYWARWKQWYKYQPLNHIRGYFGEKIAFYFAFLGFYISWLVIYAVFGTVIFVIQIYQMFGNNIVNAVCKSEENYTMCPRCFKCQKWYLSDLCGYFQMAGIFDSIPMVIFSLFSCLWANTFLANWKRYSALLAYQWSCHEVVWEEQRPRASYIVKAPYLRLNPVTGRTEPHFPHKPRNHRIVLTTLCVLVMTAIVISSMGLSIFFRSILNYQGNSQPVAEYRRMLTVFGHIGAAFIQIVLIVATGQIYTKIAIVLTEWEMHRSETEYENNLIFKLFMFQFINFFSPLFYSAFGKSKFVRNPDEPTMSILGLPTMNEDHCSGNSCFLELTIQLSTFLIAKQGFGQLLHKIKRWWQTPKTVVYYDTGRQWETDYNLEVPGGLIQNYLEIVLQFSFITLFVSAFPLAPLFALIKNVIEIRRYSQALVCKCRRPVPQQAKGIQVWYDILKIIAILSSVTNGLLIAVNSDLIPNLLFYSKGWEDAQMYINQTYPMQYKENIGDCRTHFTDPDIVVHRCYFLIIYEHITLVITLLLQGFIPTIPDSLQLRLKREQFIARQSAAETATTLQSTPEPSQMKAKLRKKRLWTAWEEKRPKRDANRRLSRMLPKTPKDVSINPSMVV